MKDKRKTRRGLFTIVWEFQVPARRRRTFENTYGPEGAWAQLFRSAEGYVRTELLRDRKTRGRYLTIDYWKSRQAFAAFKKRSHSEYAALDEACAAFTEEERLVGEFENLDPR